MGPEFYSNGKLLITGEYFVLKGALAFAIPINLGQKMIVRALTDLEGKLFWNSYYKDEKWFTAVYSKKKLEIEEASDHGKALYIQKLLYRASRLNPELTSQPESLQISNYLDFHPDWGMGSSSTLLSNLSYWLNIDPFLLLKSTTGGSGYDVACARVDRPIIYSFKKHPEFEQVSFNPDFLDCLSFIYLGNKVNTAESISAYSKTLELHAGMTEKISDITLSIINSKTFENFEKYIKLHNKLLSDVLKRETEQRLKFNDFPGTIKSLGAWGGDFIIALCKKGNQYMRDYFKNKGFPVVFNYSELQL